MNNYYCNPPYREKPIKKCRTWKRLNEERAQKERLHDAADQETAPATKLSSDYEWEASDSK